jgi:hypothetical protein
MTTYRRPKSPRGEKPEVAEPVQAPAPLVTAHLPILRLVPTLKLK